MQQHLQGEYNADAATKPDGKRTNFFDGLILAFPKL